MRWLQKCSDAGLILALVAFQAVLLHRFFVREVAWYQPEDFDQTEYLIQSYRLEQAVLAHGPMEFWSFARDPGHANGLAMPMEGTVSALVFGGARLPRLLVNFAGFAAVEVCAFAVVRRLTARRAWAYAALGLILALNTMWFHTGGLFDFRLDFIAFCLYGVWACAVLRSGLFARRRWALACGLAGAILVLNRFLTVTYLTGVTLGFAAVCAAAAVRGRAQTERAGLMWRRVVNAGLSLAVIWAVTAPVLYLNRQAIHDYYVVGHLTGPEKYIRLHQQHAEGWMAFLMYYPASLYRRHTGWAFQTGAVMLLAAAVLARWTTRRGGAGIECAGDRDYLLQAVFLLGAVIGPLLLLTLDVSKSPVVGGIVGIPLALLVTLTAARLAGPRMSRGIAFCAAAVLALGLGFQIANASSHLPEFAQRRDLTQLVEMDKSLVRSAIAHGWTSPTICFDVVDGRINTGAITTVGYEQTGELVGFHVLLGGLTAVDRATAMSGLASSDYAILTTLPKRGLEPFYASIAGYWDDLKAWADRNMIVTRRLNLESFGVIVYERPAAASISAGTPETPRPPPASVP